MTGEVPQCPECGEAVSAGAELQGLCPRCLMGVGRGEAVARAAYRTLNVLGQGETGTVYLARQEGTRGRLVAIKLFGAGLAPPRECLERQVRFLAARVHPHLARVFQTGTTPGNRAYLVTDYVPGAPVTDYCARRQLRIGTRLQLFEQICDALACAHGFGLRHGALEPGNILVLNEGDRHSAKLLHFRRAGDVPEGSSSASEIHSDVRALGRLLNDLAAHSADGVDARVKALADRAAAGAFRSAGALAAATADHLHSLGRG